MSNAAEKSVRTVQLVRDKVNLTGPGGKWAKVLKQQSASVSNQGLDTGEIEQPFDMANASAFVTQEIYHSTCIETKVSSCIGLGHEGREADGRSKVAKLLDPLCATTWQNVLAPMAQDYFSIANGYIEVVRPDADGPIAGLYHLPGPCMTIRVSRDDRGRMVKSYLVEGQGFENRHFAEFGNKADFMGRHKIEDPLSVSEVIHIPRVSALNRWYGIPDWLSAIPLMELTGMLYQYLFDFFQNRGVPEFMLFLHGNKLSDEDWDVVQSAMRAQIGESNSHKSIALNIPEEIEIVLHKLGIEANADGQMFKDVTEASAVSIVSAHRVPPLLAGIQIPGKLGSNNELPNALQGFQALVIGPAQHTFQSSFGCTLGDAATNGGLPLSQKDFAFRTILDAIDLGLMDTVSRQKTPVAQTIAEGRDPRAGLLD